MIYEYQNEVWIFLDCNLSKFQLFISIIYKRSKSNESWPIDIFSINVWETPKNFPLYKLISTLEINVLCNNFLLWRKTLKIKHTVCKPLLIFQKLK